MICTAMHEIENTKAWWAGQKCSVCKTGYIAAMFDVLVYVYEHYWRGDVCPELPLLGRKLSAAGFDADEIQQQNTVSAELTKNTTVIHLLHQ